MLVSACDCVIVNMVHVQHAAQGSSAVTVYMWLAVCSQSLLVLYCYYFLPSNEVSFRIIFTS